MRNLLWQPLAMMLVVMLCFAVVSAPAVTIAQDAPATKETTTEAVVATEEAAATEVTSTDTASTEATEDAVPAVPVEANAITPEFMINNLWIMIAGMLVFIMHLGFAALESGLTRSKNTVNILFKNTMIVCIGIVTYGICGFNLMYPGFQEKGTKNAAGDTEYADDGFIGFAGWGFLCLLYTSPSPRDATLSRMPSSA